jgi:hypothetical protein
MVRHFDGEPIGVSSDNLFKSLSNRLLDVGFFEFAEFAGPMKASIAEGLLPGWQFNDWKHRWISLIRLFWRSVCVPSTLNGENYLLVSISQISQRCNMALAKDERGPIVILSNARQHQYAICSGGVASG